jgi:hypothetical protein
VAVVVVVMVVVFVMVFRGELRPEVGHEAHPRVGDGTSQST